MGLIVKNLNVRGKVLVGITPLPTPSNDVTPNPTPNWTTLEYNGITGDFTYSSQQIQGINTTITLRLEYNDSNLGTVYYNINPTDNIGNINLSMPPSAQDTSNAPFTQILNNGTLTVSNNQWICFGFESDYTNQGTVIVSVKNVTDANTLLDQFNLYAYDIPV